MFRIRDRQRTPPHGFLFCDPLTGVEISARNHANWIASANAHRVANSKPLPDVYEMEEQLCGRLNPSARKTYCEDGNAPVGEVAGVGDHLRSILAECGINACWGCIDLARKYNEWGPDICEEKREQIIQEINDNANQRNWWKFVPFKTRGIAFILNRAIAQARQSATTP